MPPDTRPHSLISKVLVALRLCWPLPFIFRAASLRLPRPRPTTSFQVPSPLVGGALLSVTGTLCKRRASSLLFCRPTLFMRVTRLRGVRTFPPLARSLKARAVAVWIMLCRWGMFMQPMCTMSLRKRLVSCRTTASSFTPLMLRLLLPCVGLAAGSCSIRMRFPLPMGLLRSLPLRLFTSASGKVMWMRPGTSSLTWLRIWCVSLMVRPRVLCL